MPAPPESRPDALRRTLAEDGYAAVIVDGECMTPTLAPGQTVLVHAKRPARVGDVILLEARGWLEIHRVAARIDAGSRRWFVHLGDGTGEAGVAAEREVLGVVAVGRRRPTPAVRAHAWSLLLRLGAVLRGIFC